MERKESKWFNDIPCPGQTTLSDGAGYLDRLIGGRGQKQFLTLNRKKHTKNNKEQKQYSNNKFSKPKQVSVEIDDIKWIEERRKKFPKVGGDNNSEASEIRSSTIDEFKSDKTPSRASKAKNTGSKSAPPSSSPKRKTLFQKLMEMDTPH